MAGEKEVSEHNVLYTYGFSSIPQIQWCYLLVNRTAHCRAMLILPGSGKINHCISGRDGRPGAQRPLHLRIPLDPMIPAEPSACQSDYTSRSYANVYRIRQNQLLHRWEGRRHKSTTFFICMNSLPFHDSSGPIPLPFRPSPIELCYCLQV